MITWCGCDQRNTLFVAVQFISKRAAGTLVIFINSYTKRWVFNTFIIWVNVIPFFTFFTYFFTSWNPLREPFSFWVDPPIFSTVIVLAFINKNTDSILIEIIVFFTISTSSSFIDFFTTLGILLTLIITVKIISFLTFDTNKRAIFSERFVMFSVWTYISIINAMIITVFIVSFDTDIVFIKMISFETSDTDSFIVVRFAVQVNL